MRKAEAEKIYSKMKIARDAKNRWSAIVGNNWKKQTAVWAVENIVDDVTPEISEPLARHTLELKSFQNVEVTRKFQSSARRQCREGESRKRKYQESNRYQAINVYISGSSNRSSAEPSNAPYSKHVDRDSLIRTGIGYEDRKQSSPQETSHLYAQFQAWLKEANGVHVWSHIVRRRVMNKPRLNEKSRNT